MTLPFDPSTISLLIGLLVAGALVAGVVLLSLYASRRGDVDTTETACRPCHYCRRGKAEMVDHSVRVEGREIVNTRCFACRRCGLPHWVVDRVPVGPRVGR